MAKTGKTSQPTTPRRATYQDVLDAPEHVVAEIIGGALHTHSRPAPLHAYAHANLGAALVRLFGRRGGNGAAGGWLILAEPELHLEEDVLVPDLAGWRRERMPAAPKTAYFTVAPDWVCKILSPSTRALDQGAKRDIYAREGVAHLWFVDPPAQTLEVFELRAGHWSLIETADGETEVSPPPFGAAPFNLGDLWWTADPEPPQKPGVHEPGVPARQSATTG